MKSVILIYYIFCSILIWDINCGRKGGTGGRFLRLIGEMGKFLEKNGENFKQTWFRSAKNGMDCRRAINI